MANDGTKTYEYALRLYEYMADNAKHDEVGHLIWRGSITKTSTELGIPIGTYRRVFARLEELGCVQLVMRGTRGYLSVVALLQKPTSELWGSGSTALTERMSLAKLWQRVDILERRLGGTSIAEALMNIETRLRNLEAGSRKKGRK